MSDKKKNFPFEYLDKKWIELITIAINEGQLAGYDPLQYFMYVDLIYLERKQFYIFSFYENIYDSWDYEDTGRDFNVIIDTSNFKSSRLERQKGFHKYIDEKGKMKYNTK